MMQNELITKTVTNVGEEISHELGCKMVKDFQDSFPAEPESFFIGKKIINEILSQPGCVGIRFYHALNEEAKKTVVYVGINEEGENLTEISVINPSGQLSNQKGIVADRVGGAGSDDGLSGWFSFL